MNVRRWIISITSRGISNAKKIGFRTKAAVVNSDMKKWTFLYHFTRHKIQFVVKRANVYFYKNGRVFFNENDEHRHGSLLECRWIGYRTCALHSFQLKLVVGGHCCAFVVVVVVERETSHFFSAAFYLYLPNKFVLRFDWAVHPPLIVVSIQCFIAQHSLLFGNLSSKASLSQMHNEFPPFSSSIPFKLNIPLGSLWPRMRHHDHWLFSSFMTKRPQSIGRKEQRDQSKSSPKNVEVSCKWINGQWTRVSGHRFGLHNPTTSIHIIWRPKVQNRSDHVFSVCWLTAMPLVFSFNLTLQHTRTHHIYCTSIKS